MSTFGLDHARSVAVGLPLLTAAIALSVPCGCALAQSVSAESGPDSAAPSLGSLTAQSSARIDDAPDTSDAGQPAEHAQTSYAVQRRLRSFGAGSNGSPRYIRSDTEVESWRSLPSLQVAGPYRTEISELSSRWWFSTGRTDLGFGVGSVVLMAQRVVGGASPDTATASMSLASSAALSVGIRHQTSAASTVYVDATRAHGVGVNGIDGYSGKLGIEWKSAASRWSVTYSGLGVRLSPESRMTFSVRKGGLGVYVRSQF